MKQLIRIILIITITGISACSTKDEMVVDRKVTEPDLKQAAVLNVQLAIGYIERDQLGIAQEKLNKAIEQDPENIDAYTTMAYLKRKVNEMDQAEEFYLKALEIKPNDPNIHNNYGGFLCQMGRYDDAIHMLYKAHETQILPDLEELIQDEWLEDLQNHPSFQEFLQFVKTGD